MINIECCNDCVCIAICTHKPENTLIHDCEIIRDEIKTLALDLKALVSYRIFIKALNKEVLLDTGDEFLFVSESKSAPYSVIIARDKTDHDHKTD